MTKVITAVKIDRHRLLLGAILLLAAALRLYQLDTDPLWWPDEAETLTLSRADLSWAEVIQGLSSPIPWASPYPLALPPLTFLLTHLSLLLLGESEFILRLPYAIAGIATIPVIYFFGKALGGQRVGLMAAALLAISPFHIRYSQEARFYGFYALFSLLSVFYFYRLMEERSWRWWLGWVIASLLNLYTHFFGVLVLFVEFLSIPVWLGYRPHLEKQVSPAAERTLSKLWGMLVVGSAILLVGFLPLIVANLDVARTLNTGTGEGPAPLPLTPAILSAILGLYSAGPTLMSMLFAFLCIAGAGSAIMAPRKGVYLLLVLLVPFVIASLSPLSYPLALRYLIFTLPVFLLLVTQGAVTISSALTRRTRPAMVTWVLIGLGVLLGISSFPAITQYYAEGKQDWPGVIDLLRKKTTPAEIVVSAAPDISDPYVRPLFEFYRYPGRVVIIDFSFQTPLPQDTRTSLGALCAQYPGLWLLVPAWINPLDQSEVPGCRLGPLNYFIVPSPDPPESWLIGFLRYSPLSLVYAHSLSYPDPVPPNRLVANFGDRLTLAGYSLSQVSYQPGETVRLDLYWQALAPMAEDYTFFVHLLGPYNPTTGGPLWGQEDTLPKGGYYPTTLWEPGEIVVDTYQITIPREAPPGYYRIEVGVYDSQTQQRLPVVETEEETLNDAVLLPQEILIQE